MSPRYRSLEELIEQVCAQLKARSALKGAAITLAVAALSLIIAAVTASYLKDKPAAVTFLRFLPLVLSAVAGWLFIARPLRLHLSDTRIALLIEERCALSDRMVTAVEFSGDARDASPAIVDRLIEDTSERCYAVSADRIVDPRYAYGYGSAAILILLGLIASIFMGPAPLSSGMAALYSPSGDAVSANAMLINVSPGTSRVPRGSDQKIKAALTGFDAETSQIFIRRLNNENWSASRMEPARTLGEFQHVIFNIQDSIVYYVESNGVRSPEFTLEVADLPFVKRIDLLLDFPSYTRMSSKKIENGGEVAAPAGTVVRVTAALSAKAKSARIVMSDGSKIEMAAAEEHSFQADFTVKANGTYKIEITSEEGERYNGSNEYDIIALEDRPPTVSIDKPGRDMKVTSIQEIFAQARAEDDYGVSKIELYFSVNGGEERRVQLQDIKSDTPNTLSGAHTFFLEEFGLEAGDFISYYAKARDNSASGQESTSDIYFLEVRPFDRQFRQAQQQGGGEGGDQESNALTRRQREIIAATFRVQREQVGYTPEEKEENFDAVTLSQEKLKGDTEALAERIRRRLGDQMDAQPDFAKLIEYLAQAAREMAPAISELRGRKVKEALAPEQKALQQLLRAEAIFREIQVARGSQGGGSGSQSEQELADLFELQLDKMKNQYETIQRQQQANQNQQQDEIARRLQELARRQQQQIEQQRRAQQQQGGGGGGGSERQQQEMIEETRRMARELEKLSRDRRDPKLAETARQLQQAADDMQRAQASSSSSSSSSSNGSESNAQSRRALERLEQARRTLESAQQANGQQNIQGLRKEAEEALKRQDEISRGVEDLARAGQGGAASEEKKQQLSERKQALADKIAGLERDIDQTARGLGQDKQQAGDKLREAAGAIRRNRIPDRIRANNQLIGNGWYEQARDRERTIRGNLEEVVKNLQAAEGTASRRSQSESMEDTLNRARELANNLESLRRRMESGQGQDQSQQGQAGGNDQNRQGQQPGQQQAQGQQAQAGRQAREDQQGQSGQPTQSGQQGQSGQQAQSGQQGQSGRQASGRQSQRGQQGRGQQQARSGSEQSGGQQQGGQQSGQQGGQQGNSQQNGSQQAGNQGGRPSEGSVVEADSRGGGPPRGGDRQLQSEIRQRLAEAEELRRSLGRNSEMARELNRAIEQLKRMDPNAFSDPAQLALLKSEVIDPLRQLELKLVRELQAKLGNNGSGAFNDGDAPDRYRKMIEDYYRRLSVRSAEAKP